MFNNLIGKNKELGRFLFCERYTLQPVKDAMYIAEGQELKRGAVVDVNGVLVGTSSILPYAVLEFDCDTRDGGKQASVFIKGEFNFDKLSFASGLDKSDMDNIVYNGNSVGIVIKPYEYDEGFNPIMAPAGTSEDNPLMTAADTERMILENTTPAANTFRFSFSKLDYSPVVAGVGSSGTWKKVSKYAENNVWDWNRSGNTFYNSFTNAFTSEDNDVEVIAAGDTSAVTNMSTMFSGCSSLKKICIFDTSNVTNFIEMFYTCTGLTELPLFDLSSATNINSFLRGCSALKIIPAFNTSNVTLFAAAFRNCIAVTNVPLFDTGKATNVQQLFYNCTKVEGGALALYTQMSTQTNPPSTISDCFTNCGKDTTTGAAELAQIPASWGGTGT